MEGIHPHYDEKLQGFPILNKLRIIQLFEEDFNAVMKIKISRDLMRKYEINFQLGDDMHGGRQHCTERHALLTHKLTFNVSHQQCSKFSVINLDSTKCFDNIFRHISVPTMV